MLRVTFCAYDSQNVVGGPISWLLRIIPCLRSHGIESKCLILTWGDSGSAVQRLEELGVDSAVAVCRGTSEERMHWILQNLQEQPPDVFIPNLVVPAYYAARWLRTAGIPTVGVLHSDDGFYQAIQNEFVFGHPQFAVTSLVCVSRELEIQVMNRKPKHSEVRRIPYGVPIPHKQIHKGSTRFRIAYVGRLAEQQKRISDVASALCRTVRAVPGTEAVIYGEGPDKKLVENILAAQGKGLPVRLGGIVPYDQIQDKLLLCDVIVLLSDYEGLPIAVMEAMACGVVPVCLRMRSGIPELVQDGITGLIVEDRDAHFVDAIRRLKEDTKLFRKLSSTARERIEAENSIERCAVQWADLLNRLHDAAGGAKKIEIPNKFRLPPIQPELAAEDPREVRDSVSRRFYLNGRKIAGNMKRKLTKYS